MASTDISPVVARIVNRIGSVASIGLAYGFDVYSHSDLASLIVSDIDGAPTLRAWWITGPTMNGVRATHSQGGSIERSWLYTIHGVEGLTETGDDIETLRTNALAVSDALDLDLTLNDTCHRTDPCRWQVQPEHRTIIVGVGVAYVQIVKPVVTLSTP